MERVLIVNADDFGLSKGQNYGIIEACRNGVVTSTTALVNGAAIDHAAQLSRSTPELAVGMHFVLTLGEPLSAMPGLTRDGRLGKWIWQQAEEDSLPLEEIAHELACQYRRFVELFGHERRISTAITMCICSPRFIPSSRPLPARRALRYALTARWRRRVSSTSRRRAAAPASAASFTAKRSLRNCFCRRWMPPSPAGSAPWR
ncbi:Cellobiose phosphotransferase system YdjC-like protein [Klebsiella pneumoniae IS46]|nr:Cellobiose phosphotransferase system YdjC-like protein [Klebsiella pneumoniae IS46]